MSAGRQDGQILIYALVAILLLSMAMALVAGALNARMELLRWEERAVHLTALLDAGVADAAAGLAEKASYAGTPGKPFGGGSYAVEVRGGGLERDVVVRARYGRGRRAVRVHVTLRPYAPPLISAWRPMPPR